MNFNRRDPPEADKSPLRSDKLQGILAKANKGNSLHRYKIGSSDKLKADTDGSVTIYIQAASPGKEAKTKNVVTPESRKQPEDGKKS